MKNPSLKKVLPLIITGLSILITLTIFLPALSYDDVVVSGVEIAFGTTITDVDPFGFDITEIELEVSSYAIAAYFAPLIAGILTFVFRTGNVFSLAMFAMSAVLFFTMSDNIHLLVDIAGNETSENVDWTLDYGSVLAALFAIFAALAEMLHISMTERS
ncbi:MAG: hypothetical protein ACLFUQ_05770 [Candidatus Izemoplasmataceae bacterium]